MIVKRKQAHPAAALLLLLACAGCDTNSVPSGLEFTETVADSFAVAVSDTLAIEAFAGELDVRPGPPGIVRVTATKWARRQNDLQRITIEMEAGPQRVRIRTANPGGATNVSVNIVITAPPDVLPVVSQGAGATRYEGRPAGPWAFSIGAGDLALVLPADVSTAVDLSVGAGSIASDFPVSGTTTSRSAVGTIGASPQGSITATVGAGTIRLLAQ